MADNIGSELLPRNHNTARRVLGIQEVLENVMAYCSRKDTARGIRVCKAWKDTCISTTWAVVDDYQGLFRVLAPTKTVYARTQDTPFDDSSDEEEELEVHTHSALN